MNTQMVSDMNIVSQVNINAKYWCIGVNKIVTEVCCKMSKAKSSPTKTKKSIGYKGNTKFFLKKSIYKEPKKQKIGDNRFFLVIFSRVRANEELGHEKIDFGKRRHKMYNDSTFRYMRE